MDSHSYKQILAPAMKDAGDILAREYQNFNRRDITFKTPHEIVTRFDLLSEKIIIKTIKENFPEHGILSEEQGRETGQFEWLWIVDPLDGTTNFTMHNPLWTISVALAHKNDIILGMIYAPLLDEMYTAFKGEGAFLNSEPIKPSETKYEAALNTYCHGGTEPSVARAIKYYAHQKQAGFDCRQLGSAALELAYTAAGRVESVAIPGAHAWDVAAGALLVKEAGGRVTDFRGLDWTLDSLDILASNDVVHKKLLDSLKNV